MTSLKLARKVNQKTNKQTNTSLNRLKIPTIRQGSIVNDALV